VVPIIFHNFLLIAPIIFFLAFFITYKINRTKLTPGFLFTCFILSLTVLLFENAGHSDNPFIKIPFILIILAIALIGTFGTYMLVGFLFLNTRAILRKERFALQHVLTLILAFSLLCVILFFHFVDPSALPYAASAFVGALFGIMVYYSTHMTQYIISVILCNFSRPKKDQDFIIVLGSWVKDGKVTPLVAGRVDRAIKFYNDQKRIAKPPRLILSGGKGKDEECSEAQAMKNYALSKGIPKEDLLLENKSTSTLENMKFSKKIMDRLSKNQAYSCIYVANDYHLLRAGIYARKAGLNINGIGSRTRFYFLPNAILREYIAYLNMHKKWNVAFVIISLFVGAVLPVLLELHFGSQT